MGTMKRTATSLIVTFACCLLFTACQKDLCYDHNHDIEQPAKLKVVFDWSESPDANPTNMRFMAFKTIQEKSLTVRDFGERGGGETTMEKGSYKAIGFNLNTPHIMSRGDTWATYELYTPITTPILTQTRSETDSEPIVQQPDILWTGSQTGFTLSSESEETITVPMQISVYTYVFTIKEIENADNIRSLNASLSGMSESMFPSTGLPSETHAIIPFTMVLKDESTLQGSVRTFGHCPENQSEHYLEIIIKLLDGSEQIFRFDVTQQMHDADHIITDGTGLTDIPIVISGLSLPEPPNASDRGTTISDWNSGEVIDGTMH